MKMFLVEFQSEMFSGWQSGGRFNARNGLGAIWQFVNTFRGDVYAVRASTE